METCPRKAGGVQAECVDLDRYDMTLKQRRIFHRQAYRRRHKVAAKMREYVATGPLRWGMMLK